MKNWRLLSSHNYIHVAVFYRYACKHYRKLHYCQYKFQFENKAQIRVLLLIFETAAFYVNRNVMCRHGRICADWEVLYIVTARTSLPWHFTFTSSAEHRHAHARSRGHPHPRHCMVRASSTQATFPNVSIKSNFCVKLLKGSTLNLFQEAFVDSLQAQTGYFVSESLRFFNY